LKKQTKTDYFLQNFLVALIVLVSLLYISGAASEKSHFRTSTFSLITPKTTPSSSGSGGVSNTGSSTSSGTSNTSGGGGSGGGFVRHSFPVHTNDDTNPSYPSAEEERIVIANLQEQLKTLAPELTSRIAISLSAIERIAAKFSNEGEQILAAKNEVIPIVKQALDLSEASSCVAAKKKNQLTYELNSVAAINWIDKHEAPVVQSISDFETRCIENRLTQKNIDTLLETIAKAQSANQRTSFERGLTPFADVPTHEWYYGSMLTGHATGFITQGRPAEHVLRQDALLMVLRANGATDAQIIGNCTAPKNIDVSNYAKCAISYAYERNVILPNEMKAPTNRLEIAGWIEQFSRLKKPRSLSATLKKYTDVGGLNITERMNVATMVSNHIMVGNIGETESIFRPFDPLTRAALSVILEQLLELNAPLSSNPLAIAWRT